MKIFIIKFILSLFLEGNMFVYITYIMKKKDIEKVIYVQRIWRNTMLYKNDIENEIKFFNCVVNKIISDSEYNYRNNLIQNMEYRKCSELIEYINNILDTFPSKITLKFLSNNSKFKILSNLAKIKLGLIEITNLVGNIDISGAIKLYLSLDINDLNYKSDKNSLLNYISKFFIVTKVDLYSCDEDDPTKYTLYNYNKKSKKQVNIVLNNNQLNCPSINKCVIHTKNLELKINACKIYLPIKDKLLSLCGYFKCDNINSYEKLEIYESKTNKLYELFENLDIYDEFKNNYRKSIGFKDYVLNTEIQLSNLCVSAHTVLVNFKNKNISNMVKDFILSDIEKQRYLVKILLMDTNDNVSNYIANLLLDLYQDQNHQMTMLDLFYQINLLILMVHNNFYLVPHHKHLH